MTTAVDLQNAADELARDLYSTQQGLIALHELVESSSWWRRVSGPGHRGCEHGRCKQLRRAMRRAGELVAVPAPLPRRLAVDPRRGVEYWEAYVRDRMLENPGLAAVLEEMATELPPITQDTRSRGA